MKGHWRYIDEKSVSASYGLAVDEYLMDEQASGNTGLPASLRLYTYKNYSALAGRFQHIDAEIDVEACRQAGYGVSRRLTGGGAIIMGEDQLGICLAAGPTTFTWGNVRELYLQFSKPIIAALEQCGVKATFRAKNDLEANGKKIAGLGVHISPQGGIQFHASLLLDMDIPQMLGVLKIPIQKYADKRAIQSVSQRITTVKEIRGEAISLEAMKGHLLNSFSEAFEIDFTESPITEGENIKIKQIESDRYNSPDWIFQHSPQHDMNGMSLVKTEGGLLRTYVALKGENIKSVMVTGDFFDDHRTLNELETRLKWSPMDQDKIREVVNQVSRDFPQSLMGIDNEALVKAVCLAAQRAFAANRYTYKGSCYYPKENTFEETAKVDPIIDNAML